jgi:NitT/TauT family transport system permease protein
MFKEYNKDIGGCCEISDGSDIGSDSSERHVNSHVNRESEDTAISPERRAYLSEQRVGRLKLVLCQVTALLTVIALWEFLARKGIIDSFIMSQPSRILRTLIRTGGGGADGGLIRHIGVTCAETLVGFALGVILGNCLALALWWSDFLAKAAAPFLVVLNALPKIALGPVIIIWAGAGMKAIIVMALAISLVVTVLVMLNGFLETDTELIKMARTFGAGKWQTFTKIVFPSNLRTLFSSLKVNIGLSLVGVIAGEFLVSKAGLGYLIVYGSQVFQMDLVMTSVIVLAAVAALLYRGVTLIERLALKFVSH